MERREREQTEGVDKARERLFEREREGMRDETEEESDVNQLS